MNLEEATRSAMRHAGHRIYYTIYNTNEDNVGVSLECEKCQEVVMCWDRTSHTWPVVTANEILASVPEPWETEEHLCGYSVYAGDEDYVLCYHQGCWEENGAIQQAADIIAHLRRAEQLSPGLDLSEIIREIKEASLANFLPAEEEQSDFDRGYDAAIENMADWLRIWCTFETDGMVLLTEEEYSRVASVVDNGGKFEDFIERELFFIREA